MSLVRRMDTVDERFEVALHDGERCPELMAHIGEKAPPLLFARLETAGHRVERARESARLAGSSFAHSGGEIAVGDAAHRLDHVSGRSGEPTKRSRRAP